MHCVSDTVNGSDIRMSDFETLIAKRQSTDQFLDSPDKRQRVELESTSASSLDFSAFLTHVSTYTPSQIVTPKTEQHVPFKIEQTSGETQFHNEVALDPLICMRILSLPMLESLAIQIISLLSQKSFHDVIRIFNTPESKLGQSYITLKTLFDQAKRIYSQEELFLSADRLEIKDPEHREIIRTSNLATFICSVFDGHDGCFLELNNHFISTFAVEGMPLQKEAGDLLLNLKTQIYLSAVSQEEQERTREDILEDFFHSDLAVLLESRHPNEPLSQTEDEFLKLFTARRELLANSPIDLDSLQALSEAFSWQGFLKKTWEFLGEISLLSQFIERYNLKSSLTISPFGSTEHTLPLTEDDLGLQVELAAKQTLESLGLPIYQKEYEKSLNQEQNSFHDRSFYPDYDHLSFTEGQTAPTQVLYERARHAAVTKVNQNNTRRPGLPSQRRPWSSEEERALMAGLDQVRGPHWSQILVLYGIKGTISEVLKDRNQVQLKDKARNLKLFFLKSGIEVPYYLKSVTGELKTRAPTQAAKREAEGLNPRNNDVKNMGEYVNEKHIKRSQVYLDNWSVQVGLHMNDY